MTGGAQGIGAAYAAALAAEGADVVIADIVDTQRAVDTIGNTTGRIIGVHCDVASAKSCDDMAAAAIRAFGKIDILVNNAAIFASITRKPFEELSVDEWDQVMAVNVRGTFNAVKAVFPDMKKNKRGKIINVSSATVFSGTPGMLHYVTSKGAVVAFTRSLAREVAVHGITVNGIAPGLTMSEGLLNQRDVLEPFAKVAMASRAIKREQLPEDLVGTLLYLASSDSDFMTGQTITVDGGYVMR
ncbi:MAG TPA: SDR family oxidoreductase [Xanthobacteraceae bacterium]|nr:SDR family oxidoreductase [Xanthobacteraceae bacterium]